MSKIKWGAIVVDGRGKLGGHVFTKTKSGATMRTKVTPVNPQSSAQASARSRLGGNSQAWAGLDESQRQSWISLAAETSKTNIFGDQYFPSGKNLFTSVNNNLVMVGRPQITTAPKPTEMPFIVGLDVLVNTTSSEITFLLDVSGTSVGNALVIEASQPSSAGKYNFDGGYRQIAVVATGVAPSAVELYDYYVVKFGEPPVGKKIAFRCYFVNNTSGASSPRFSTAVLASV